MLQQHASVLYTILTIFANLYCQCITLGSTIIIFDISENYAKIDKIRYKGETMTRKYEVKCIHCNSDLNREWLHTLKAILHPCVHGAINDTITQHGPITKGWSSSATKRVVGALLTRFYELDCGIDRTKLLIRKLDEAIIPDITDD